MLLRAHQYTLDGALFRTACIFPIWHPPMGSCVYRLTPVVTKPQTVNDFTLTICTCFASSSKHMHTHPHHSVLERSSKKIILRRQKRKKICATCEARTHDLQIMRLTRCRLRQGGTCCLCFHEIVFSVHTHPSVIKLK